MATSAETEGGIPTGATPAVIHIQQEQSPVTAGNTTNRQHRWGYGYFAIAMAIYHFIFTFIWMVGMSWLGGFWGSLVLLGGVIPSLMTFVWLIVDSTVSCCNPPLSDIENICGCDCLPKAKQIMVYPMAIATCLRSLIFIVICGVVAGHNQSYGDRSVTLNIVLYILFWVTLDLGPLLLLTVDWWYYYGKKDMNGIFGTHLNPMRPVVSQSIVLMVASWTFIGALAEFFHASEHFEYFWPWIFHGIVSTALLIFCYFLQKNDLVKGNKLQLPMYRMITRIFGCLLIALIIAVLVFCIELGIYEANIAFYLFFYYYSALSVPSIIAMFAFEVQPKEIRSGMEEVPDQEQPPEYEMQSTQTKV